MDDLINQKMVEFINEHENDVGWDFQSVVILKQFADELKKEINGGNICR